MLQGEHSAVLSTFIKLHFPIKTFVLYIFKQLLKTGFTVLLTLFVPMELSVKFDTVESGLSIVYIEGSQVTILKKKIYISFSDV